MYSYIIIYNLLISAYNADETNNLTLENDDLKINNSDNNSTMSREILNNVEADMMSLLYEGVKTVLRNLSNDIPFLNSLGQAKNDQNITIKSILENDDNRRSNQNEDSANQSGSDLSLISNSTNMTLPSLECISCNSLETLDCNSPLNKDLTSIKCTSSKDVCYSTHTPFGIVDRGCINIMHHKHTYVCKCNLCNFRPISEIPIIYNRKQRWIEDVFEISYKRRLQRTIFKGMSCLSCEVNATKKGADEQSDADCLEGKINILRQEVCAEDQVCAVRTIRDEGYLWRGCLSSPLYNYWWTFCDSDLCNHDALATVYDVTVAV